jgi:hypothetical protein
MGLSEYCVKIDELHKIDYLIEKVMKDTTVRTKYINYIEKSKQLINEFSDQLIELVE